jgi:hypothetical protein
LDEAKRAGEASQQTSELVRTPGSVDADKFENIEMGNDVNKWKVETSGGAAVDWPWDGAAVIDLSNLKKFEERLGSPTFIGYHGSITPLRADANGIVTQDLEAYANEVSDKKDELGPGLYATYDKETAEFFLNLDTHTYERQNGPGFMYEIYIMPASKPLAVKDFPNVRVLNRHRRGDAPMLFRILNIQGKEEEVNAYIEDFDVLTAPHIIKSHGLKRLTQQTKINPRLISQKGRVVMRLVEL